jgi:hypothetical protein
VKNAVLLLLVSMLIGAFAAFAALAICSLTSASLSPAGGALLGLLAGVTRRDRQPARGESGAWLRTVLRGLAAAGAAALVVITVR